MIRLQLNRLFPCSNEIEEGKGLDKATLKILKGLSPEDIGDLDEEITDVLSFLSNASNRLGSKLTGAKEIKIARDALREISTWTGAQAEMTGLFHVLGGIARALEMNSILFPGAIHPKTGRDFGNALLSPWPLEDARKLILPGESRFTGLKRVGPAR